MLPKLKIRPRRIRVSCGDGTVVLTIRVADFPEESSQGDAELSWRDGRFHLWVCLPDLPNEAGPHDLTVEERVLPVPTEVGWDDVACSTLMGATMQKPGLTLG